MRQVKIYDSLFTNSLSATLGQMNSNIGPKHFAWQRGDDRFPTTTSVFTDSDIEKITEHRGVDKNILWLLEPVPLHPENYEKAVDYEQYFDVIFTHSTEYARRDKWEFCPVGGAFVPQRNWHVHRAKKNKAISIIASEKDTMPGHKLRHEIIEHFGDKIDAFGLPHFPDKSDAHVPYRYSIVVESASYSHYFTEKLIDSFLTGCVPIYWGDPDIDHFFNPKGMLQFSTLEQLDVIMSEDLKSLRDNLGFIIEENFNLALRYTCAEDWLPL